MPACFAAVLWLFKVICLFLFDSGDRWMELYPLLTNSELSSVFFASVLTVWVGILEMMRVCSLKRDFHDKEKIMIKWKCYIGLWLNSELLFWLYLYITQTGWHCWTWVESLFYCCLFWLCFLCLSGELCSAKQAGVLTLHQLLWSYAFRSLSPAEALC